MPSIVALIFLIAGIYFIIHSMHFQSTDDAFVEGHIITVAPRVKGQVIKLLVDDNEEVKKGQLLVEIDPNDYITALNQKEASLESAKASLNIADKQINRSESELMKTGHDIKSAKSKLDFAQKDYKRYSDMYKEGIASKQEYDAAKTKLTVAQSEFKSAIDNEKASNSMLQSAKANKEASLAEIKNLKQKLNKQNLIYHIQKFMLPKTGLLQTVQSNKAIIFK